MEEKMIVSPKLLISFVLDNSASMAGPRLGEVMSGFRSTPMTGAEFELLTFDGFAPKVVKRFEDEQIAPVKAGGFPLLGRAVSLAAERLLARVDALTAAGERVYRPWLIVLSDGFTLDAMDECAATLDVLEQEGKLLCLPFKLSGEAVSDRLQPLDRTKHMVEINEGCVSEFFAFVSQMIERRAALAAEEGLKFSKSDFEGWATL